MEWHPFLKAKAYDNYLEMVDDGEIVVLTNEEAIELAKTSEVARKYLEKHSNWLMPSIFMPGYKPVKPLDIRPATLERGRRRKHFANTK